MGFKTVVIIIVLTFFLVLGAYGIEKGLDKLSEKFSTDPTNSDNVNSIISNSTGLENINTNTSTLNTDSGSNTGSTTITTSTDSTSVNNTNTNTSTNNSETNTTSTDSTDSEIAIPETYTVSMTSIGFFPVTLTISSGDTVVFVNDDSSQHWPASDRHPTHTEYPGSGISKCGSSEDDSIFDSCGGVAPGESYQFQFNDAGIWGYHDHLKPGLIGVVEVV